MSQGSAKSGMLDLVLLGELGLDFHVGEVLYLTSSTTFDKANYPGLWGVRVKVQAGGGGGGGCQGAGAGQGSSAGGGGGGGYVEALIPVDSLEDEETVTVGAGGGGGAAGHNDGSDGGDSSFGAHAVASGGRGGDGSGVTSGNSQNFSGAGGNAPTGDIRIRGDFGGSGHIVGGFGLLTGFGGGSFLGGSVRAGDSGQNGISYGGGGSGARNATGVGVARAGGDGADGIVVIEVLYDRRLYQDQLQSGYRLGETVYFTGSGTFSKADYPGMRAVRVKCQGAGGGGGGVAATGTGERAVSAGGNGGGYAEKLILVGDLADDETVTVGAGGSGGPAGNNGGSSGGDSSFGSHCEGEGGIGGSGGVLSNSSTFTGESGSSTLAGGTGDLVIRGGGAGVGFSFGTGIRQGHNSQGGGSHLGAATNVIRQGGNTTGSSGQGSDGIPYGGGASGLINRDNALATAGKDGAAGIVIVEVLY